MINEDIIRTITSKAIERPTREVAEDAVRTLIRWANDDPRREGLLDTPKRVVNAYEEFFSGYAEDPINNLQLTFEEVSGYNDIVALHGIPFESHCEHHIAPIIGKAHIAYLPRKRVVGISKLARTVEIFAKRLQIQEKMTAEIATSIYEALDPLGVAVIIDAKHHCLSSRGIHKAGVTMRTSHFLGLFDGNENRRREALDAIQTSLDC